MIASGWERWFGLFKKTLNVDVQPNTANTARRGREARRSTWASVSNDLSGLITCTLHGNMRTQELQRRENTLNCDTAHRVSVGVSSHNDPHQPS